MRTILLIILILTLSPTSYFSQIINKEGKVIKEKKTKNPSYILFEANRTNSFRTLAENKQFITLPLGERAKESPLKIWSYFLGMNTSLNRFLRFQGGISFLQTGEQYLYQGALGSDSTYSYQTKYRYFAMPCQLTFEQGKQLRFSIGAGIMPQLFNSYRQNQQWTTELGGKYDNTNKEGSTCNSFGLSLVSSAGLHYVSARTWGIYFKMTYRYQLTNTLTKYGDYEHFSKGLGYSIGISKNIE